jgi:hypothetical protein
VKKASPTFSMKRLPTGSASHQNVPSCSLKAVDLLRALTRPFRSHLQTRCHASRRQAGW